MDGPSRADVSKAMRWFLLLLVSLVIATNYYAFDALSSIKATLQLKLGLTSTDYGAIVSAYAFPNTFLFMAVIGGIVLDRIGIRKTGFLFTACCTLGVFFTAYGASDYFRAGGLGFAALGAFLARYSPELKMMVIGRLLFGMGAETSIVVINKVIAKWFKEAELAFAFAVNLAVARLGTAAALILSPVLIKAATGWTTAIWVAVAAMSCGLLCFVFYNVYDRRIDRGVQAAEGSLLDPDEVFRFSDIVKLLRNVPFIAISLLCVTFYAAIFPFQAFCPDFLHHKFGLSLEHSGFLTSLIIWGTIIFTPLFGWLVDKRGRRATLMLVGSAMLLVSHLVLALTSITPYVAMFVLGIAFSLVPAAMWPSVALIVDEKRLGTAYGLMTSIQNLGLFAFPILAGAITDAANPVAVTLAKIGILFPLDYTYTILMFSGLGVLGLIFAVMLRRASRAIEGVDLERPSI